MANYIPVYLLDPKTQAVSVVQMKAGAERTTDNAICEIIGCNDLDWIQCGEDHVFYFETGKRGPTSKGFATNCFSFTSNSCSGKMVFTAIDNYRTTSPRYSIEDVAALVSFHLCCHVREPVKQELAA